MFPVCFVLLAAERVHFFAAAGAKPGAAPSNLLKRLKQERSTLELAAIAHTGALDRQATIEAWVTDYGESVLKLAYAYMKDRHLAEDIFQDVFTKAYLHLDRFRGQSSPKTWLYRITVNLCRDRLGAWSARKVLLLGEEFLSAALGARSDTEEAAFDNVDAELLLATVLKLPLEYREVLMLVYYEDLALKQVGEALSLPGGTVRTRLFRARQKLKQLLEEGGWEA